MNQKLQNIIETIQQSGKLDAEQKKNLIKAVQDADKEFEITAFKLDRTEKVKKTTAILLEETIEELEQKRKAVEAQNRELEIEAALERVRTVAMSMSKSDDLLSICEVSFKEFQKLGFDNLRNALIHILNDEKGFFMDYDYSDYLSGSITNIRYDSHPIVKRYLKQIKKADDAFAEVVIKSDQLDSWKDFRRGGGQQDDPKLEETSALYYYLYSIGVGDIGISTFKPIDESQINILKRFRNVFDLAYRRYNDIALAEAQAREAEIELALERVRARTMAMHKGDELADTALLLFEQITKLGIKPRGCGFLIMDEESESMKDWSANVNEKGKASLITGTLAFDQHPMISDVVATWRKGAPYFIGEIHGKDLQKFYKAVTFQESTSEAIKDKVLAKTNSEFTNSFYFEYGMMYVLTPKAISEHEIDIMLRFAKVFKQTYTRFLDLQKAEAQARESEIQLSLERIRAHTMAMNKSADLKEVIQLLYQEFKSLGLVFNTTAIHLKLDDSKDLNLWSGTEKGLYKELIHWPYANIPIQDSTNQAWQTQDFQDIHYDKKEKDRFLTGFFKIVEAPEAYKKRLMDTEGLELVGYFKKEVGIVLLRYSTKPFRSDERDIVRRFTNSFEQSYTRFLDLQKAEAQAREAQIEAALERVRSRTMAMHESSELADTAAVLFKQLIDLGIAPNRLYIGIMKNKSGDVEFWITDEDGSKVSSGFSANLKENRSFKKMLRGWIENKKSLTIDMKGKELQDYFQHLQKLHVPFKGGLSQKRRVQNIAYFSQGLIGLASPDLQPEETINLLERFAAVFNLTYRRFLDLQQAEAQTREAQIQLALERIRARTMAMQHSDELLETAQVLFQQFKELGENPDQLSIGIVNESERVIELGVSVQGVRMNRMYKVPIDEPVVINKIYDAWKKQKKSLVLDISGNELKKYKDFRNSSPEFKEYNVVKNRKSKEENRRVIYVAFFPKGLLSLATPEPRPEETVKLLERFASVFDLTYTRFLDLQKAEAQAREAQIQLALERVRARTMAMHNSEELSETSFVLFEQLKELGEVAKQMSITIYDEKERIIKLYSTIYGNKWEETGSIPFEKHSVLRNIYQAWKKKKNSMVIDLSGKELNDFNKFKMKYSTQYKSEKDLPQKRWVMHYAFFSKGALTFSTHELRPPETIQLLERFAGVFNLTYTRFLDLQKAEAQAREAQIEAALERVRSCSLAMHRSSEFQSVVNVIFDIIVDLKIETDAALLLITGPNPKVMDSWIQSSDRSYSTGIQFNYYENSLISKEIFETRKGQKESLVKTYTKKEKDKHFGIEFKHSLKDLPEERKRYILSGKAWSVSISFAPHIGIFLSRYNDHLFSDADNNVIARLAKVVEQTYTRFLDLRKAEAQAREAQIEAALEKIRAGAMAMHKSDELTETASVLFHELKRLGIESFRSGVCIFDYEKDAAELWLSTEINGKTELKIVTTVTGDMHPMYKAWIQAGRQKKSVFIRELAGKQVEEYYKTVSDVLHLPPQKVYNKKEVYHGFFFGEGTLNVISQNRLSEDDRNIMLRFASVFGLLYRRFLDLQKAEAQAREAQIEAALEKVRSRTMGMQKSEELKEVIQLVYEQFVYLNIHIEHTGFIMDYKTRDDLHIWLADQREIPSEITIPCFDSTPNNSIKEAKENGRDFFTYLLTFEEKNEFYRDLFKFIPGVPEESLEYYFNCPGLAGSGVLLENVGLYIENFSGTPYSVEDNNTLMRFGKVFQQTYTRFLDLQKAEAQAREAQIEAALEKVRSRSLAMHKSNEMQEVVNTVFERLKDIKIDMNVASIFIFKEGSKDWQQWVATSTTNYSKYFHIPYIDNLVFRDLEEAKNRGKDFYSVRYSFKQKNEWFSYAFDHTEYKQVPKDRKKYILESKFFLVSFALSKHSGIQIAKYEGKDFSLEENEILKRFSRVFEQAYIRFLDLQRAEAQAREAQIEAALERVRGKAMGMHSSKDISDTMGVVFTELPRLGIGSLRCGVVLLSKGSFKGVFYAAATTTESDSQTVIGEGDMSVHPIFMKQREHWIRNKNYFVTLSDDDLKSYYKEIFRRSSTPYNPKEHEIQKEHGYYFSFSEGMFYAWSEEPYSESDINILNRFKSIIDLTFRRYFDLKKAEAQAREAVKQAAMDRVRGEIASMRTSEDLNRITPIIWRELETLEVPFIRCGVFIVDEENEEVRVYLTTPDGKSLGALNLPFGSNRITSNTVKHWKKNQVYKEHWNKEKFIKWTKSMIEIGQVQNAKTYQGSSTPPESLDLHFVPFTQGMLYVGNVSPLTDEKLELVKTLAEAFSIAYARYEDFKNIEEAKDKIEVTLNELKSTQAQLIHSEKMASLGELTAGIAHEIKNPLNFVNNFSDVSRELLDEMKTELQNENDEEVIAIIEDLKQNLQRINQHGKRADSIVKGMLLHSRGTSGEKMLTDINNLLDEYVNLAYHGMRAQNSEFNITMEKDYDKSLERINVVPQDISRVFMNIISNACYAAYDKKKTSGDDFDPVLKVSTKNLDGRVQIRIGDNGNGIPANILDKIFQPFFTTKPTGEGTGLGLSLSYDIVTKVHGGELKVETKAEEGAEFIISLPK